MHPSLVCHEGVCVYLCCSRHITFQCIYLCVANVNFDITKAKITPIYKKKAKTEAGNYRPVSVLSIIPKVIEKIACEQLCYMNCSLASAHHFQLTLVLFTYQILLGNSKTRGIPANN